MIDTTMGSPQMATMPVSRRPVADPIGGQSEMSPFRLVLAEPGGSGKMNPSQLWMKAMTRRCVWM